MKARTLKIGIDKLNRMVDRSMGFCAQCRSWTTGCCEPDARQYPCTRCGESTVYGAEEIVMMGLLEVVG